ncbi:hypothetical protein FBY40_3310 [Microbacterium sp. SLBN-154]|uniref:hypothetical protein n=1 Tax=Microbacterium sp. SLBN-154 TaxID=2768458 RepID=UPI00115459EA|nr:hypothetical protein [Microbacterium sp. SLBN-154]TQK20766.1 hypothetical protein FBY40_3310 [Microbacterium sp. SLBN-154]
MPDSNAPDLPPAQGEAASAGSTESKTKAPSRILVMMRDPFVLTVTALAVVLNVVATVSAASDGEGDGLAGNGMFAAPIIATLLVVLQVAWRRDGHIADAFVRAMVYSAAVSLLCALASLVTTWVPAVAEAMAASRRPSGFHYWFEEPHPFVLPFFGGWLLGMIAGLVGCLLVILFFAYRRPRDLAAANMNDLAPAYATQVRRANIALAWVLILVFLVPSLIVWGSGEAVGRSVLEAAQNTLLFFASPGRYVADAAWIVGLVLIPVGIVLVVFIVLTQRVDRAARRAAGVPVGLSAQDDDAKRSE